MTSLKFGTSGLRGLVTDLAGQATRDWTGAFLAYLEEAGLSDGRTLYVGRDLRSSSARIAVDCLETGRRAGWQLIDCGALPTPALALAASSAHASAIMVTGSHIPDDRNGLKFYVAGGEIAKSDEAGIEAHVEIVAKAGGIETPKGGAGSTLDRSAETLDAYRRRYLDFFVADSLAGLTVGLYEQSSVARDVLADILMGLGARVVRFGRSDRFIPVDTEAHRPEDLELLRRFAAENDVDAIVSTDGDADRPLVADASGKVVRGDLLGLLAADFLGLRTVVTPVTSSAAIENSGIATSVLRTRVGSPFVIAGMEQATGSGKADVIGFEANGGVLQASALERDGRTLAPLPTRDAVLPIVCALAHSRERGLSLAPTVERLGAGYALADRLKEIPAERSGSLLGSLADDAAFASAFLAEAGTLASSSSVDGVRFVLDDGSTVHFRASGNAPEFRCYVEASTLDRAEELLSWGLSKSAAAMR
jgi:phosphomannomutase